MPEPVGSVTSIAPGLSNMHGCAWSMREPRCADWLWLPAQVRASPKTAAGLKLTGVEQDA